MANDPIIKFVAARTGVVPNIQVVSDGSDNDNPKARIGGSFGSIDREHAVLAIREAPRLGADVTSDLTLRRYLETTELAYRAPTGRVVYATDDFLMTTVQEVDSERYSIIYNFGNPVVQTSSKSGRQPRLFNYQGSLLINKVEGSSAARFEEAWEKELRGTVMVNGQARAQVPYVAELLYRDQRRIGYLTSMNKSRSADSPNSVVFSFELFVIHQSSEGLALLNVDSTVTSRFDKAVAAEAKEGIEPIDSSELNSINLGAADTGGFLNA